MDQGDDELRLKQNKLAELLETIAEHETGQIMPTPETGKLLMEWREQATCLEREIGRLKSKKPT